MDNVQKHNIYVLKWLELFGFNIHNLFVKTKILFLLRRPDWLWGTPNFQWVPGRAIFSEGKAAGA
jgi:hypothetical protein